MTIRVLLIDDHPVVRAGYRRLLEQGGGMRVVGEAGGVEEGFAVCIRTNPDVAVIDLSLPGEGGLELIRRLAARDDRPRMLVFSMHDGAALVRRVMDLGACGFLSKSAPPPELLDAVRAVHRGERYLGAADSPRLGSSSAPLASLTPREFEIFRLLAQGCSAAECARSLALSAKTVANHQTAIKEKLGVTTSAALVHVALQHGVIAPAPM
jgi:DNA-binding NarL/FixJ family response regulator